MWTEEEFAEMQARMLREERQIKEAIHSIRGDSAIAVRANCKWPVTRYGNSIYTFCGSFGLPQGGNRDHNNTVFCHNHESQIFRHVITMLEHNRIPRGTQNHIAELLYKKLKNNYDFLESIVEQEIERRLESGELSAYLDRVFTDKLASRWSA